MKELHPQVLQRFTDADAGEFLFQIGIERSGETDQPGGGRRVVGG